MRYVYAIKFTNGESREVECMAPAKPDLQSGFMMFPITDQKAVLVHPDHVLTMDLEVRP